MATPPFSLAFWHQVHASISPVRWIAKCDRFRKRIDNELKDLDSALTILSSNAGVINASALNQFREVKEHFTAKHQDLVALDENPFHESRYETYGWLSGISPGYWDLGDLETHSRNLIDETDDLVA